MICLFYSSTFLAMCISRYTNRLKPNDTAHWSLYIVQIIFEICLTAAVLGAFLTTFNQKLPKSVKTNPSRCFCMDFSADQLDFGGWLRWLDLGIQTVKHASTNSKLAWTYIWTSFYFHRPVPEFNTRQTGARYSRLAVWTCLWWELMPKLFELNFSHCNVYNLHNWRRSRWSLSDSKLEVGLLRARWGTFSD